MQGFINQVENKASFPLSPALPADHRYPAALPPQHTHTHTTPQRMCSKAAADTSGLHQEIPGLNNYPKEMQVPSTEDDSVLKNDSKSTGRRKP